MKELTNPMEIEQMKLDLFDMRITEQKLKGDYTERLDDGKNRFNKWLKNQNQNEEAKESDQANH